MNSQNPKNKRAEILDDAARFHLKGWKITAESIVNAAKTEKMPEEQFCDDNGKPVPRMAQQYWNRRDQAKKGS